MKPKLYTTNKFIDERGFLINLDIKSKYLKLEKYIYEVFTHSNKKNIFRGFHFQKPPYEQEKLLILISGEIEDYSININSESNFGRIYKHTLKSGDALWIPKGFCHGFKTLSDNVIINYKMTNKFYKKYYTGILPEKFNLNFKKNIRSNQDLFWKNELLDLKKINWKM